MSENLSPVTAETTSLTDEADTDKTKKKKKALGAFIVEAEPDAKRQKFWELDKSDSKSADKSKYNLFEPKSDTETAESAEIAVDTLESEETSLVVSQLAADRRQELAAAEMPEAISPEEQAAVDAYLASVEASGEVDPDEAPEIEGSGATPVTESEAASETIDEPDQPAPPPASSGGSSGRPPIPPTPPTPPVPPQPPNGGTPPQPPRQPFQPPMPAMPIPVALRRERQAQSEGLVVGAVVGYLMGRRRGRIKSEKRLLPVQKKLEQQVNVLQTKLRSNEAQIRQQVRQQLSPIESINKKANQLKSSVERAPLQTTERLPRAASVQPERIGHVLVQASSGQESLNTKKPNKQAVAVIRHKVEAMDRQQLLEVSQTIKVEGTTLKQIYETQLVSEKGLRRLVAEHLRGGNVNRVLKRELVERQIDFERDPILRDQNHTAGSEGAGKTALAAMLQQAGMTTTAEPQAVGYSSKVNKPTTKPAQKARSGQQAVADVSLITVISILIVLIGALLARG